MNQLYFGDCLAVLRELEREHKGGFIDLIYIDPPFSSKRNEEKASKGLFD